MEVERLINKFSNGTTKYKDSNLYFFPLFRWTCILIMGLLVFRFLENPLIVQQDRFKLGLQAYITE